MLVFSRRLQERGGRSVFAMVADVDCQTWLQFVSIVCVVKFSARSVACSSQLGGGGEGANDLQFTRDRRKYVKHVKIQEPE